MYHLELRQFPHNVCRFNLSAAELRPIVERWARELYVEVGERKWSPSQAKLTILEGPEIPLEQLTMGRGWRAAQRVSSDATARLLAAAAEATHAAADAAHPAAQPPAASTPADVGLGAAAGAAPMSDPLALGVQIAALLGPEPMRLLDAWRAAAASSPDLAPSESLARAEDSVASAGGAHG